MTDLEVRLMGEIAARKYLDGKTRDRLLLEVQLLGGACVIFFVCLVASIGR